MTIVPEITKREIAAMYAVTMNGKTRDTTPGGSNGRGCSLETAGRGWARIDPLFGIGRVPLNL